MSRLLGVDMGGTTTKVLLVEERGGDLEAVDRRHLPTPRGPGALDAVAADLAGWLADLPAGPPLDGLGLSVPGVLDQDRRQLLVATNLPWLDGSVPAEVLASALGTAGTALNDGDAAALAEARRGAAKGASDVFVVALGTGVAGAHVVDGELRRGAHGAAGEVGHIGAGTDLPCSCGQRGCLETAVGGAQLSGRWDLLTGRTPGTSSGLDVVEAARAGDPGAVALLDGATTALASTLLTVVALLDPGVLVVGGGLAQAADLVVGPTAAKMEAAATFHRLPPLLPAALGPWAGAWGAVLAARPGLPEGQGAQ